MPRWMFPLCLALLVVAPAAAQTVSPQDRAAAQVLFDEASALMDQKRYAVACTKFEESQRLDPGIGTRFRLGDCYELVGRLASAWIQFVDVAAAARAGGQPVREQIARRRAAALVPRLTKLRIVVTEPLEAMTVERNQAAVPRAQWGSSIPIDSGEYRVHVRAPGKVAWRKVIVARGEGKTIDIVVPVLKDAPRAPAGAGGGGGTAGAGGGGLGAEPAGGGDVRPSSGRAVRVGAAVALASVGLVSAVVGSVAGVVAIDKKNGAGAFCPEPNACFDQGIALLDEARTAAALSTLGFGLAGGALVGAAILWLSAPDAAERPALVVTPWASPQSAGLGLAGAW